MRNRSVAQIENPGVAPPATGAANGPDRETRQWRRARRIYLGAIGAFIAVGALLAIGLQYDPRRIPSPLIGKPIPEFTLPPVKGRTLALSSADLTGEVSLVNVFASWCVACRDEHPLLMRLHADKVVPIHGLNYKDAPDDATRWLDSLGDPYTRTGADIDGRVAIEWGVYGVPETFVVDKQGTIRFKHIGPLTPEVLEKKLTPLLKELNA